MAVQHVTHAIHHVLGTACLVASSPLVEPSAPELRAHQGTVGTQLLESAELVVDVGTRTEVHRPGQVVQSVLGKVGTPVTLEEFHLVKAALAHHIAYGTDVLLVLAVAAVFVLHLYHDDGATLLDGQVTQLFAYLGLKLLQAFHEEGVFLAQAYVLLLEEPPGQTAHFPFRTNVGTGAYDDIHAILLRQFHEGTDVVVVREVELIHLLLVDVPEDVDAQRVHAESLAHLDALFPVGTGNTGVMDFGSLHHEGLAVEQEGLVTDSE